MKYEIDRKAWKKRVRSSAIIIVLTTVFAIFFRQYEHYAKLIAIALVCVRYNEYQIVKYHENKIEKEKDSM